MMRAYRKPLVAMALSPSDVPALTAIIAFAPLGDGPRYRAMAIHGDEAGRKKHEAMGFHEGWGTATEQLAAVVEAL